jgi:hypothetical protein
MANSEPALENRAKERSRGAGEAGLSIQDSRPADRAEALAAGAWSVENKYLLAVL